MTAPAIIDACCRACGVTFSDLCSRERQADQLRARKLAAYLLRTHAGLSFGAIARLFGKRGHVTVLEQYRAACRLIETDAGFEALADRVWRELSTSTQTPP